MTWKYRKEKNDTYVLFNDESYEFAAINSQAFMIWQDLLVLGSPNKLAEKYSLEFSAPKNEILRDILNTKRSLISLGVINDKSENSQETKTISRDIVKNPIWGASVPLSPFRLFVTLTRRCNIKCTHCYNESSPNVNEYLSIEAVRSLIQQAVRLGVFELILSGGEPFVYPELDKVLEMAVGNIAVSIVTNGMLASKTIDILTRFTPNRIQVSIDGDKHIHDSIRGAGAYNKSLKGIELLNAICKVSIGVTVTATLTISGFHNLCSDLKLIGINEININRLLLSGRAKKTNGSSLSQNVLEEIAVSYGIKCNYESGSGKGSGDGEFHCGAGASILSIAANGNIYPCSYLQLCEPESIGNIYKDTLNDVWNSIKIDEFRFKNKQYRGPEPCLCDEILKRNS